MSSNKRARTANYTLEESIVLVDAVERNQIVNCKKTDASSNKTKVAGWDKVAHDVNAATLTTRTGDQYRLKYDTLKRETRRRHALDKAGLNQTGGGVYVPKIKAGDIYDRIRDMHPVSVEGLPECADSDGFTNQTSATRGRDSESQSEPLRASPDADTDIWEDINNFPIIFEEATGNEDEPDDEGLTGKVVGEDKAASPVKPSTSSQSFDGYTPSMLRQKKNPLLRSKPATSSNWASRRRPALPLKKESAASASISKFSDLAACKAQLAELQMKLLELEEGDRKLAFKNAERRLDALHDIEVKIKLIQQEDAAAKLACTKAQLAKLLHDV